LVEERKGEKAAGGGSGILTSVLVYVRRGQGSVCCVCVVVFGCSKHSEAKRKRLKPPSQEGLPSGEEPT